MAKGKLEKFAEMEQMNNVFQAPYSVVKETPFEMKGRWNNMFFMNNNPIVLELGCGKGEYTVGLARLFPDMNFIGVDIKGSRMWTGAKQALDENLTNVAFLRTNIEAIDRFFGRDEISSIWLTFSDPQMKKVNKRLTSVNFLQKYRQFLKDDAEINVKTDSNFLYTYTKALLDLNNLQQTYFTEDLYGEGFNEIEENLRTQLSIRTYYEQMWLDRGIKIRFVRFLLPRAGELAEPDIEIPEDTYRSYGRNKRTQEV